MITLICPRCGTRWKILPGPDEKDRVNRELCPVCVTKPAIKEK